MMFTIAFIWIFTLAYYIPNTFTFHKIPPRIPNVLTLGGIGVANF